jgi:DNA polymerase I-like protein with 3'-5' exonuclease and polymerase domains
MINYAAKDVILTWALIEKLKPIVKVRKQMGVYNLEKSLIVPIYNMEAIGFNIDIGYLNSARVKVAEEIKYHRNKINSLAEQKVGSGQHPLIKIILNTK